jgi:tRNA threonylcarbamoyl adenosine modification protein (Sua5/YciO/YrdC/YwlC family)
VHLFGAFVSEILVCVGKTINQRHVDRAIDTLRKGEVIVLPTETGYCYAGIAEHKSTHPSLLKLREAHPRHKPFSLLCLNANQVAQIAQLSTSAYRVVNRVLPGPFTLILPVNKNTPKMSTGEFRSTVGIRISGHPVAQALCQALETPLMVTSVTDGEELLAEGYVDEPGDEALERWWTSAEGVLRHSQNKIKLLIAGDEPLPLSVSTILDLSEDGEVRVLRDGGWELNL